MAQGGAWGVGMGCVEVPQKTTELTLQEAGTSLDDPASGLSLEGAFVQLDGGAREALREVDWLNVQYLVAPGPSLEGPKPANSASLPKVFWKLVLTLNGVGPATAGSHTLKLWMRDRADTLFTFQTTESFFAEDGMTKSMTYARPAP